MTGVKDLHDFHCVRGDPVNEEVVRVHDDFPGTRDTAGGVQIRMFRERFHAP